MLNDYYSLWAVNNPFYAHFTLRRLLTVQNCEPPLGLAIQTRLSENYTRWNIDDIITVIKKLGTYCT